MRAASRAFVLVLAAMVGGAPLAECLTPEPMTPAQMACCAAADHDCGAAALDRSCCRAGEPDRSQLPAPGAASPAPVHVPLPGWPLPSVAVPKLTLAVEAFDREILKLPERPTYLLVSVLLI
ncbi:MAG TPA: hypothetical protein VNI83_11540 [Vicinamibacterales bacterium]|nr:hypothetical protein [Vicinamibacterales bacterium]